eukprot:SAG22_NODE_13306_length_411_cov_0.666667_2_plen_30_part_01
MVEPAALTNRPGTHLLQVTRGIGVDAAVS